MAEVLGVVVSALTVVDMTVKLGSSAIKLKKLWDQVHDTPSEIGQLVAQVELLNAVLAEADAMSDQVYSTNNNPSVISLNYCQHAVNHLETLVTDLQQQMTMANKPRRSIARLKFTLKKDLIQNCQNKLQVALQMVVLSQNTRILASLRAPSPEPSAYTHDILGDTKDSGMPPSSEVLLKQRRESFGRFYAHSVRRRRGVMDALPWRQASLFGTFAHQTSPHSILSGVQVYRARYAIFFGHISVIKNLLSMGLSLDDIYSETLGSSWILFDGASEEQETMLELFHMWLYICGLDQDMEAFFVSEGERYQTKFNVISSFVWKLPEANRIMATRRNIAYYKLPPKSRFACLGWQSIDPQVLLNDIHHGEGLKPAEFSVVFDGPKESSMESFVNAYVNFLFDTDNDHLEYCQPLETHAPAHPWRHLAQWVLRGVAPERLSRKACLDGYSITATTLFALFLHVEECLTFSGHQGWAAKLRMAQLLSSWLEDAELAGLDLGEYGRQESEIFMGCDQLRLRRWFEPIGWDDREDDCEDVTSPSGFRLQSFTYGPHPTDWALLWILDAEEYAGEFWDNIEIPPSVIPGGWVEDGI
ncbi:hypothetical protein CaCOL14_000463 [Colletotrichum acutatum]